MNRRLEVRHVRSLAYLTQEVFVDKACPGGHVHRVRHRFQLQRRSNRVVTAIECAVPVHPLLSIHLPLHELKPSPIHVFVCYRVQLLACTPHRKALIESAQTGYLLSDRFLRLETRYRVIVACIAGFSEVPWPLDWTSLVSDVCLEVEDIRREVYPRSIALLR